MSNNKITKTIAMSLTAILVLQLAGCGTIFYPERKGQRSGQIDPVVAVADAIGLLFYFIPGVIAFAVDFNNGTIYSGHGKHSSLTPKELKSVTENGKVNNEALSKLMSEKLGQKIDIQADNVQVKQFTSENALLAYWNNSQLKLAGL